jgi:3',5'-cyclic AMP phosphodiesterase CpdA
MNGVTQWEAKEIIREKNAAIEALTAENERLKREIAVVGDAWEQQKDLALTYLIDCNEAVAENERLREALTTAKNALTLLSHGEGDEYRMEWLEEVLAETRAALAGKAEQ